MERVSSIPSPTTLDSAFGPVKEGKKQPRKEATATVPPNPLHKDNAQRDVEILKMQFTQGVITVYLVLTGVVCIYIAGTWPLFRNHSSHLLYLTVVFTLSSCFSLYKMGTVYD